MPAAVSLHERHALAGRERAKKITVGRVHREAVWPCPLFVPKYELGSVGDSLPLHAIVSRAKEPVSIVTVNGELSAPVRRGA